MLNLSHNCFRETGGVEIGDAIGKLVVYHLLSSFSLFALYSVRGVCMTVLVRACVGAYEGVCP